MKVLFVTIAFLVLMGLVLNSVSKQSPPKTEAEQERERKFQLAVAGAMQLRDMTRDPDSFQVESARVVKDTDALCYQYRARNGFGGMNRERAVIDIKGNRLLTERTSGFVKVWNKECADKEAETIETVNSALKYVR